MRFAALLFCIAPLGWAQIRTFDAVSIRHCDAGAASGNLDFSRGRIILNCIPLKTMIAIAWGSYTDGRWNGIPLNHIEGGPSWTDPDPANSSNYTVIAKSGRSIAEELMRGPMFRAILEDRLQLKIRRETRQVPVFALTVGPRGSMLRSFDGMCTLAGCRAGSGAEGAVSKATLQNSLTRAGNRRIVDMPGTAAARCRSG